MVAGFASVCVRKMRTVRNYFPERFERSGIFSVQAHRVQHNALCQTRLIVFLVNKLRGTEKVGLVSSPTRPSHLLSGAAEGFQNRTF